MLGIVVLLVFIGSAVATDNCFPYGHPDASLCTTHSPSFIDLYQELVDAKQQEHFHDFVLNFTLGTHHYLYPCQSLAEAAFRLFYDHATIPDVSSPRWTKMVEFLGNGTRLFDTENDLLRSFLDGILTETVHGENCIQALIDEFKGFAGSQFHSMYTNFVEHPQVPTTQATMPTTTTLPTTTHPTTTTTLTTILTPHPPTRTHPPTTTTHPPTTTTHPTTITTIPPTHSVVTTPVERVPAKCSTCSGFSCSISSNLITCPNSPQEFCYTAVEDTTSGRVVTRGCATVTQCNSWLNLNACAHVETSMLPAGLKCHFCCYGNDCNHHLLSISTRGEYIS